MSLCTVDAQHRQAGGGETLLETRLWFHFHRNLSSGSGPSQRSRFGRSTLLPLAAAVHATWLRKKEQLTFFWGFLMTKGGEVLGAEEGGCLVAQRWGRGSERPLPDHQLLTERTLRGSLESAGLLQWLVSAAATFAATRPPSLASKKNEFFLAGVHWFLR